MKKVLAVGLLLVCGLAFAGVLPRFFKCSDTTKTVIKEITSASPLELVAGVAGQNIAVRSITAFVDAACLIYCYQGSTATNYVLFPPADQDGNFGVEKVWEFNEGNGLPILDAGNALNIDCSADPDQGFVQVEYFYVKAE